MPHMSIHAMYACVGNRSPDSDSTVDVQRAERLDAYPNGEPYPYRYIKSRESMSNPEGRNWIVPHPSMSGALRLNAAFCGPL